MAENIKTRKYYRMHNGTDWDRMHFVTDANSVDANDGDNMETKVGAIKGITTSTAVTEEGYAADATTVAALSSSLGGLKFAQDAEGNWGYIPSGADTVFPFKSGDGNQKTILFYDANGEQIGYNWGGKTVTHTVTYTGSCAMAGFTVNTGGMGGTAKYVVYVNDIEVCRYTCGSNKGDFNHGCTSFPVNKGDVVKMVGNGNSSSGYGYFTNKAYLIVLE